MTGGPDHSLIQRGREAMGRHAWADAYEALSRADREGSLTGEGLHLLGSAAYWTARPDETVSALERAFAAYLAEGDQSSAAMMAFRVAEQYGMRMSFAQVGGWVARAERMAEGNPDWPVQGWLMWVKGLMSWFAGDFEAAVGFYDRALELAARSGDRDLHGMSLHDKGHALCLLGRVSEGTALLDEAMVAVVAGELGPEPAGYVYCGMIGICSKLGDYRRAGEWTEATLRWCERQSVPAFPGVCRIHKAELLRLGGSLARAEEEARMACEELPRFNFYSGLGPANYEIGEVRRRLGDFRGAEEAYARANEFGYSPQPGLSLLRLAQGKVESASSGIRQALAQSGENHCLAIRLLAAHAQIAMAAGDLEAAASAADQLESIVGEFEASSLHSIAAGVRGAVRLAQGDPAGALPDLMRARQAWQEIGAPHEVAELRLVLARAHMALGDADAALMEARTARDTFERLGARPAAEAAGRLVGELAGAMETPERVRRAFMFTDIVKSTDLVSAIGDEAWEELLAWHDQTLRSHFASNDGQVAHHTGDGFFVAFESTSSALECAVAVQLALAEHRRAHGFAPLVRIGVHAALATRRGEDFSGAEVHKAARVAALAEGGEILVTSDTAAAAEGEGFALSQPRNVSLKGIPGTIEVVAIEWR
jgi:class 3 adenylate cyclase